MTLEERIKRIICASEIELDGEAYIGKYGLGNRKSITSFILNNLRKTYINLSTGNKLIISRRSGEKLATHIGEVHQKVIAHIPQIIEKMQFLEKMAPDKENASFDNYSYYITPIKIDGKNYTILSTVGQKRKNNETYYDQNVFKGTPKEVFENLENSDNNTQFRRLAKILKGNKEEGWSKPEIVPSVEPTSPTNKYSKISEE